MKSIEVMKAESEATTVQGALTLASEMVKDERRTLKVSLLDIARKNYQAKKRSSK